MMTRFPSENCASKLITSENGTTRTTSDSHKHDAGCLEVLLHETLLNPVHAHQVVDDLLHKTLQDHVLGEDLEDATPPALPPSPPPPPSHRQSRLLLLDGEALPRQGATGCTALTLAPALASAVTISASTAKREDGLRDAATVVYDSALQECDADSSFLY